jgi:hypothetical protein
VAQIVDLGAARDQEPGDLARTTTGPVLLTGDTCHTRWGWDNSVEPGTSRARGASRVTT